MSEDESRAIARLVRKLGRRSRVRPVAERLLDGEALSEFESAMLIDAVCDRRTRRNDRRAAIWALGWTPRGSRLYFDAVSILCDVLQTKRIAVVAWGCLGCLIYPVYIFIWPIFIWAIRENNKRNQMIYQAAQSLGRLRAPESAAALAAAVRDGNWELSETAAGALVEVLSVVGERDAERCASALPDIYRLLPFLGFKRLIVVLKALQFIGDGRAVQPLERLAKDTVSESKRAAIERVLPIFRERLAQERAAAELLRAAMPPVDSDRILLRPAGTTAADASALVRPVE